MEALDEASVSSQALTLSSSSVELVAETDFTIGDAVQTAAEKIRDFIRSQLPCADITVADATLTIEYGGLSGSCTFKGQTYSGKHSISVERNQEGEVLVHQEWDEFANLRVSVSGEADVTWNLEDRTRHIEHALEWTRLSDGRSGIGSGDRTQTVLQGGLLEGIEVAGERSWEGEAGTWNLEIDDIEIRWVDPVPQAGSWVLETPFDNKSLSLSFEREDQSSIRVTAETGHRSFEFIVRGSGLITRAD